MQARTMNVTRSRYAADLRVTHSMYLPSDSPTAHRTVNETLSVRDCRSSVTETNVTEVLPPRTLGCAPLSVEDLDGDGDARGRVVGGRGGAALERALGDAGRLLQGGRDAARGRAPAGGGRAGASTSPVARAGASTSPVARGTRCASGAAGRALGSRQRGARLPAAGGRGAGKRAAAGMVDVSNEVDLFIQLRLRHLAVLHRAGEILRFPHVLLVSVNGSSPCNQHQPKQSNHPPACRRLRG